MFSVAVIQQSSSKRQLPGSVLDGGLLVHCTEVRARLAERIWVMLLPNANDCKHIAVAAYMTKRTK